MTVWTATKQYGVRRLVALTLPACIPGAGRSTHQEFTEAVVLVQLKQAPTAEAPVPDPAGDEPGDVDLDVSFLETGSTVEDVLYLTNDDARRVSRSACSTTGG